MRAFALALVLLLAPAARADLLVRNPMQETELRLLDAPCSDPAR